MRNFDTPAELDSALKGDFRFTPEHGPAQFHCAHCGTYKALNMEGAGGTGYARGSETSPYMHLRGQFVCYDCCALTDRMDMENTGRATLYLAKDAQGWAVTNWVGTLKLRCGTPRKSFHNIARHRYDVWFTGPDGATWHGVKYGDNTQICHCRRTKAA